MEFELKDNKEKKRFEVEIEASTAFVEYEMNNDIISLTHTEVPEELGGQGVGSKIVGNVLSKIKEEGKKVKISCPFIKKYVEKHPEFDDLVV